MMNPKLNIDCDFIPEKVQRKKEHSWDLCHIIDAVS